MLFGSVFFLNTKGIVSFLKFLYTKDLSNLSGKQRIYAKDITITKEKHGMVKRKELKRRGKQALKKHYLLFAAVCLIAAFIHSEFSGSLTITQTRTYSTSEQSDITPSFLGTVSFSDVLEDVIKGDADEGKTLSEKVTQENKEQSKTGNPAFGRTRGVLANIVNQITSGSIIIVCLTALRSLTGSESLGILFLILGGSLLYLSFWYLIQNIYIVISRRIFLEGRCYEEVPIQRFVFLLRIKRWLKVSWIMFVTASLQLFWSFTVIGGIIKRYSYFLVPYITAENPDLKALEAITLSRKMMKGHKWQCFVFELSFIGWTILGAVTFGLSNLFYSNPYQVASYTEYYVELRRLAKKKAIPGAEFLNDKWLYEKPDSRLLSSAYADVIQTMERPDQELPLKGFKKFLAEYFGILIFRTDQEMAYEKSQAEKIRIFALARQVKGKTYPSRLFPIPETQRRKMVENLHYIRHYSIWSLILIFFIFAFIGWIWEVSLHLITDGEFVNRGALHGPWLPIYGTGGILILTLLNKLRTKPIAEFFSAIVLCGIVEYTTSYIMELTSGGMKWWDYSGYFLNLHGRICAEGLLVFGVGGMMIVYILAPLLDNLINKIKEKKLKVLCIILVCIYLVDYVYSAKFPNTGKGITDYAQTTQTIRDFNC